MMNWLNGKFKSNGSNKITSPDSVDSVQKNTARKESSNTKNVFVENPLDSLYYNISDGRYKKVLIFNHHEYRDDLNLDPREGTNFDCDRLVECFSALGFTSEVYTDEKSSTIVEIIINAAKLEKKDVSCIIIMVLTYGHNNVLFAHDQGYSMNKIVMPFVNSLSLAGVPKIFFIQTTSSLETDSSGNVCKIPKYADFLWVYSTIEDKVSLEYEDGCNVFIQTLCDYLNEDTCNDYNILQILALVNKRLSTSVTSHNPENLEESSELLEVDLPHYKSTLTKLLKLCYLHGTVKIDQEK